MPLTTTPSLSVLRASRSASGQITIIIRPPYQPPLYLGVIYITLVTSGPPVSGTVTPGSPPVGGHAAVGGHANLQVNASEWAYLCGFVTSATPFWIEITYDNGSFIVADLICTVAQAALASEATLKAVSEQLASLLPQPPGSGPKGPVGSDIYPASSKSHPSAE